MMIFVVAIIGRPKKPPHRRQSRQLPSMGAEMPLLEERCHEVKEWWQMRILVVAIRGRPKSHPTDGKADSSPQVEPLLEERCHEVTEWWQI